MDGNQTLIDEIEQFCQRAGIAESTFGRQVVNDGKFVGRLRGGRGVTTTTVSRVRRYMSARSPATESLEAASDANRYLAERTYYRFVNEIIAVGEYWFESIELETNRLM